MPKRRRKKITSSCLHLIVDDSPVFFSFLFGSHMQLRARKERQGVCVCVCLPRRRPRFGVCLLTAWVDCKGDCLLLVTPPHLVLFLVIDAWLVITCKILTKQGAPVCTATTMHLVLGPTHQLNCVEKSSWPIWREHVRSWAAGCCKAET